MPKITRSAALPAVQADAVLDQAAPVQNTWYTVLDTALNVRIFGICANVADTGETLELKITTNNKTWTATQAANANTNYFIFKRTLYDSSYMGFGTTEYESYRAFMIESRSVKVEVRKTTAAGAGNLRACVSYAKW